jgi:uncharacterized protein
MEILLTILQGGLDALLEYLSAHVLSCLIPAFFIAGAISTFLSQASVLKYFGPEARKPVSYGVASVSGSVLSVCSCTVLPLFGGIYRRGAGLGPAIAFLYSGPAINVLAIVFSARLLGYEIGIARAIGAVVFAIVIGLIMAFVFQRNKPASKNQAFTVLPDETAKNPRLQAAFFASLLGILIFAAAEYWVATGVTFVLLGVILWRWFNREEIMQWLRETLRFVRLVVPWLLVGVFAAGILRTVIPPEAVAGYVGENSISANFIASFLGALMYFATLTEVPVIRAFMDLGMHKGPALALLLAGPALSLPNMLVIRKIMGTRKTVTFVSLVVIMATISGYLFGLIN